RKAGRDLPGGQRDRPRLFLGVDVISGQGRRNGIDDPAVTLKLLLDGRFDRRYSYDKNCALAISHLCHPPYRGLACPTARLIPEPVVLPNPPPRQLPARPALRVPPRKRLPPTRRRPSLPRAPPNRPRSLHPVRPRKPRETARLPIPRRSRRR